MSWHKHERACTRARSRMPVRCNEARGGRRQGSKQQHRTHGQQKEDANASLFASLAATHTFPKGHSGPKLLTYGWLVCNQNPTIPGTRLLPAAPICHGSNQHPKWAWTILHWCMPRLLHTRACRAPPQPWTMCMPCANTALNQVHVR